MLKLYGNPVNVTQFPDNTSQVWQLSKEIPLENGWNADIKWEFEHESEFMHLAQLVDLLRSKGINEIRLNIDYLPYARQDKEISNDTTFALHTFAKLLNSLQLDKVTCLDVHSDIAEKLINNFKSLRPTAVVFEALNACKPDVLCFPDEGAKNRYGYIARNVEKDVIYGTKTRDQKTGYITDYEVSGNVKGKSVLIIDDICDGGMTFKILTKHLLEAGATEVCLYVTHGIFSKGLQTLVNSGISRVFTQKGETFKIPGGYGEFGFKEL